MRLLLALVTTSVLLACGSLPPPVDDAEPQTESQAVEFLITSAAHDFRRQRSPQPVRFRDVRSGYLPISGGTRQYRLCGDFLPANADDKAGWIAFATIKTSPYEQWLGEQAQTFCKHAEMKWDEEDLSARLLDRFNSLR